MDNTKVLCYGFFLGFIESLGIQPTIPSTSSLYASVAPCINKKTPIGDFLRWNVQLMPSWQLLERDHRLWCLMRKAIRVNFLVFLLSIFLFVCTAFASCLERFFRGAYGRWTFEVDASKSTMWTILPYLLFRLLFHATWSLRALLRLVGQWPLYITLQLVGITWYNQLYSEVWMIRKGLLQWHAPTKWAAVAGGRQPKSGEGRASPASVLGLPSLPLSPPSVRGPLGLMIAICRVVQHTVRLTVLLLARSTPPAPPTQWLMGDQKHFASIVPGASSLTERLEVFSETLFKLVATSVFAFWAVVLERVLGIWPILPYCGISLGTVVGFVMNSFLYSFYVFDYRYALQLSPTLSSRLTLVEQLEHYGECWAYNIGYGSSVTLLSYGLTWLLGPVGSVCIVSIIYAWQVACSGYARPIPSPCTLHIFLPWFWMLDLIKQNLGLLGRIAAIACLSVLPLWFVLTVV